MATRGLNAEDIATILEFNDNDSIIDGFSDDDDDPVLAFTHEPTAQEAEESSSSEYSSDDEVPLSTFSTTEPSQTANRRVYWKHQDSFAPSSSGFFCQTLASTRVRVLQTPYEYFTRYIPERIYETFSVCSNQTYLIQTGKNLGTTKDEIKIFFGVCFAMSYLRLPRIKMYWMAKTRIPMIADRMTRDRFFKIRTNLKLVNDLDVSSESKQNKFWKVQPLIETVRAACLENPRPQEVSVDEQMIPFWGKVSMRQFIRGKPNPCGMKNFMCTAPDGIPLDFFLYEGKGDTILSNDEAESLDIGGKVVLRLVHNLPEGTKLYMDRYFMSVDLLDKLRTEKKMQATGTLRKTKIPKSCNFKTDKQLRNQGRGSCDQLVRNDGQVACLKWFDNKPVVMASSGDSKQPENKCRRWCKKTKQYIKIDRPFAIKQYNEKMGGVDMLDRVIIFYRNCARTKKWTIRLIFNFFDFAAPAGWLVYRKEAQLLETPKKDTLDYLEFKADIANSLLYFTPSREQIQMYEEAVTAAETPEGSTSRKRKYVPQPPLQLRTAMAANDSRVWRSQMPLAKLQKQESKGILLNLQYAFMFGGRAKLLQAVPRKCWSLRDIMLTTFLLNFL